MQTEHHNVYIFRENIDLSFIKIQPGEWVVIKPNLLKECNSANPSEWKSVITSGELIAQVCEHVCKQLQGQGKISICDAPQTDSSFKNVSRLLGLETMAQQLTERYKVMIEVLDLRDEEWTNVEEVIVKRDRLPGDPNGTIAFNLGRDSYFYGFHGEGRYFGAAYDTQEVNAHHHDEIQEYLICGTPVNADVFINMPKLKTHRKTGVTLNLKNLVGINADKNWLPHHTDGSPKNGGDQFPDQRLKNRWEQVCVRSAYKLALNIPHLGPFLMRKLRKAGKVAFGDNDTVIRSGNWFGNDTAWRMVLDLNRCLLYGNPDGTLRSDSPKRYYSVIDGIVGMEGRGPSAGEPVQSNVVIGGTDPAAVDMVAARLMGFDWRKISMIREAFRPASLPVTRVKPENVIVVSDEPEWNGVFLEIEDRQFLNFAPHFGWTGHIEYERNRGTV